MPKGKPYTPANIKRAAKRDSSATGLLRQRGEAGVLTQRDVETAKKAMPKPKKKKPY